MEVLWFLQNWGGYWTADFRYNLLELSGDWFISNTVRIKKIDLVLNFNKKNVPKNPVQVDAMTKQVLVNLLSNAFKLTLSELLP
jgi:signal transduction histidine kinase